MRHEQFLSVPERGENGRRPVLVDPGMDALIDTERRPTSLRRIERDELSHVLAIAGQTLPRADRQGFDWLLHKNLRRCPGRPQHTKFVKA